MRKLDYEYGTNPRKIEPTYKQKKIEKKDMKKQIKINEEQRKEAIKLEKKQHNKNVAFIIAIFLILLAISYRSSLINEKFTEIQGAKEKLASIEKTNGQLEVSIESSLNLSNIEQSAKNNLGMQRLDNAQKVYVTLDKKDYVEASTEDIEISNDTEQTWYQKILNKILGEE